MDTATAVITGGSGFLGTALRLMLGRLGIRAVSASAGSRDLSGAVRCRLLYEDLVDLLRRQRVSALFHLAGSGVPHFGPGNARRQHWANVGTTEAVVRAVEDSQFSAPVVFASSAAVYGSTGTEPVIEDAQLTFCTAYGRAKTDAERVLLDRLSARCGLRIARIFHVFGPGQSKLVVYDLAKRLVSGESPLVIYGTGDEVRDFVYVDDVVKTLVFLGFDPSLDGRSFVVNLSTGVPTRIADLASMLLSLDRVHGDTMVFTPSPRRNPIVACVGDPRRLAALGRMLLPISPAQLAETLAWVRHGEAKTNAAVSGQSTTL